MIFFVGAAPHTVPFSLGHGAVATVAKVADYAEEDGCFILKCFPGATLSVAGFENGENYENFEK